MKKQSYIVYFILFLVSFSWALEQADKSSREIESKRTHYSKTFFNEGDSTFTTRISAGIMHYKDRDGNFQPIDTRIVENKETDVLYNFEVTRGVYRSFFKKELKEEYPVVFELPNGMYFRMQPYALGYLDQATGRQVIIDKLQQSIPSVQGNEISYKDIFNGVDLQYIYLDKKLKEEIKLTNSFRDNLKAPSRYGLSDNSSMLVILSRIDFNPELEVSTQSDVQGERSLSLAEISNYSGSDRLLFSLNSELQYILPVDVAYMEKDSSTKEVNSAIVLPRRIMKVDNQLTLLSGINFRDLQKYTKGTVIMDPTIQISFAALEDTWLENTNINGISQYIIVAKQTGYSKKRSLLKFNVSSIPTNSVIQSANLKVYYYGYSGSTWVDRPVRTYRLTRNWLESQATVSKATSSINWTGQWAEGDYVTSYTSEYTFTYGTYGWKTFDIKSMVEKWVSKPDSNFGALMKATNEDADGCDVRMRSSEYTDTNYRPYLEVTYSGILARNYYLKDHLGDIRVTIDENGTVIGYNDYYPFGLQMVGRCMNNGISDDIYKYSGKELDEENGLNWYYFGARYYDPAIGRWMSVDPASNILPELTPFHYCRNNPLNRFDLNGQADFGSGARLASVAETACELNELQPKTTYTMFESYQENPGYDPILLVGIKETTTTYCNKGVQYILNEGEDYTLGNYNKWTEDWFANKICEYLSDENNATELSWGNAVDYAKEGATVILTYYNPGGIGHVAIVAPEDMQKAGRYGLAPLVYNVGVKNGLMKLNEAFGYNRDKNKSLRNVKAYILDKDKESVDERVKSRNDWMHLWDCAEQDATNTQINLWGRSSFLTPDMDADIGDF